MMTRAGTGGSLCRLGVEGIYAEYKNNLSCFSPPAARRLHQQCLAIKQAVLPSDHALISKSYNNIGALLGQLGQYPEAARYQQLSLNMISSIMGEGAGGAEGGRQTVSGDHATDAVAQPVDADRMERRAGGVEGAAEGPACSADEDAAARLRRDSPDVILLGRSLNNMGNLKAKMGLYSEARAYHERSISIIEASMGMQVRQPLLCASTLSVCCAAALLLRERTAQKMATPW